jgi:hypothetical protein
MKSPKASGGLCNSHYWQKHKGRELTPLSYRRNVTEPWLNEHVGYEGDDCLIWPFQRLQDSGMAAVRYKGKQCVASRVMCVLAHGKPPTDRHHAAHSCGNGHLGCMNPKHLSWKTPAENAADKVLHGTQPRGEACWNAKLSEAAVREIRALSGKLSHAKIGKQFGICHAVAGRVIRGEIWRQVI